MIGEMLQVNCWDLGILSLKTVLKQWGKTFTHELLNKNIVKKTMKIPSYCILHIPRTLNLENTLFPTVMVRGTHNIERDFRNL
jgi:hypothetical protein